MLKASVAPHPHAEKSKNQPSTSPQHFLLWERKKHSNSEESTKFWTQLSGSKMLEGLIWRIMSV